MRRLIPFLLLIVSISSFGQKKEICFTIDDLPFVNYGMSDTSFQKQALSDLVHSFTNHQIPAIGFVNGNKLYSNDSPNTFQISLLELWINNGLELGNHTYSHPDYNKVSYAEFTEDIMKGEQPTKQILESQGMSMTYFRHPFLHTGDTQSKSDSLKSFLKTHQYIEAPVTIDNDDYLFALAYKRAYVKNDTTLMTRIGSAYITYMEKKVLHFEKQAKGLFNRDIKQILLLHSSLLNSVYVDALADMLIKNNYAFISLEEALRDEAYNTEVNIYPEWGISWLDRWALSQNKPREFFLGEPDTPAFIKELAK